MSLIEHLEKLRHFSKLCDYSSINAAAKEAGISQGGLSKSLQQLEDVLESELFVRSPKGLILTPAGELALKATQKIFIEANSLQTRIKSLKDTKSPKKIRIGMYDSVAIYLLPELSSYWRQLYPDMTYELIVDKSSQLLSLIHKKELDVVLCAANDTDADPSIKTFRLFDDHYSFYAATSAADDSELPLIFHPTAVDGKGKSCEKHIARAFSRRSVARVYNFETIKELTLSGLGIGVMPTRVARSGVQSKGLRQISLENCPKTFGLHSIQFLVTNSVYERHSSFVDDLLRMGDNWSKA